jgi:anti-anti-sigma factor
MLKLTGEHDLSTVAIVDEAFKPIEASGTTIVVDFTETRFIDSTVINALIERARRGETLLLVAPRTSTVRKTLDLLGITGFVSAFETREQVLQAVAPQDTPPLPAA